MQMQIYEVVKVEKGVALFLEEHNARLRKSAKLANLELQYSDLEITDRIYSLISKDKISTGRLKYMFQFEGGGEPQFSIIPMQNITPPPSVYAVGVDLIFWNAERKLPNIKQLDANLRQTTEEVIKQQNVYELLLVNQNNEITEGSKSNFFAIKDNVIFTSPTAKVLPGVTRKFVKQIAQNLNIDLVETELPADKLVQFETAFLSGTSIGVLPVRQIEGQKFDINNNILKKLQTEYQNITQKYIDNKLL